MFTPFNPKKGKPNHWFRLLLDLFIAFLISASVHHFVLHALAIFIIAVLFD